MNNKNIRTPFRWTAKVFNFNGRSITDYNILEYREKNIKQLKKKYPDKDTFSEALRRTLLSQYWSILTVTESTATLTWLLRMNSLSCTLCFVRGLLVI